MPVPSHIAVVPRLGEPPMPLRVAPQAVSWPLHIVHSCWIAVLATLSSGIEFTTMQSCTYLFHTIRVGISSRVESSISIRAPPTSSRAVDASDSIFRRAEKENFLQALTPSGPEAAVLHHVALVAPTFAPLALAAVLVTLNET